MTISSHARQGNELSLLRLYRDGLTLLRSYSGLALVSYGLQLLVSVAAAFAATRILAFSFADRPYFDAAIEGDLLAMITAVREEPASFVAIIWLVLVALALYVVMSWFLTGGFIATFLSRPQGRDQSARVFGAGGAATFLAYARLALWTIIPNLVILLVAIMGAAVASNRVGEAFTMPQLILPYAVALLPAVMLMWINQTAVDYARIELSCDQGLSSLRGLLRGYRLVASDWRPLFHVLGFYGFFAAVTGFMVVVTTSASFAGAAGAMGLLLLRQGVSALRFAGRVAIIGGQTTATTAQS